MKLVIIESPYAGAEDSVSEQIDRQENKLYLNRCIRDCVLQGESPYASHKMLTDSLDDNDTKERELGIQAGLDWRRVARERIFYVDRGWSSGMLGAKKLYDAEKLSYVVRRLDHAKAD